MKRILITGSSGFVGHHFVHAVLTQTDWEVVCLDRLDYSGNHNRLAEILSVHSPSIQKRVKIVYHDLKARWILRYVE